MIDHLLVLVAGRIRRLDVGVLFLASKSFTGSKGMKKTVLIDMDGSPVAWTARILWALCVLTCVDTSAAMQTPAAGITA